MDSTRILIGAAYVVLGFTSLPVYARLIWVLFSHSTYREHQCYMLLALMGIHDCVYCFGAGIQGISLILDMQDFDLLTVYTVLAVSASAWQSMLALNLVLAVNRLQILCNLKLPNSVIWSLAVLAQLYGLFFVVSYTSRLCILDHDQDGSIIAQPSFSGYCRFVRKFNTYSSITIIILMFAIYVCIVARLVSKRRQLLIRQRSISKSELKIMVLALVILVLGTVLAVLSHTGSETKHSAWSTLYYMILALLTSGWINPGLLMLLNRQLRRDVFKRSQTRVTTVK